MIPKTISASSLQVADGCLARYKAENIDFTPSPAPKTAANVGTSVHGALEKFVEICYMAKTAEPTLELLLTLYRISYLNTFDTVEHDTPEYRDGEAMLKTWHKRTSFEGVTVVSVEKKYRMSVPSSVGDIPLSYIWDRCEIYYENGKKILRVVDYKTIQAMLSPDRLRGMLQPRIYDLAARVHFKDQDIDEFQIVFDLLRHEPIGLIFSRDEAVATWQAIKDRLERIIAADEDNPPETLNPDCPYCVRKTHCRALRKNIKGEGIFSLDDIDVVAHLRREMDYQFRGLKSAIEELDGRLIAEARDRNVLAFPVENGDWTVNVTASKRRSLDNKAVAKIIGPDIMAEYGKVGVTDVDKLIAAGRLTDEQVEAIRRAMSFSVSDESIRIVPAKK